MSTASPRALHVLIVEDHDADVRLLLEFLRDAEVPHEFTVCENTVEAGRYLYRLGPYSEAPHPDLIILDINLPIFSGLELLAKIKADPKLARLPVVVFSSSKSRAEINRAYDLGAACYVVKPGGFSEYERVARWIRDYWLRLAALPSAS